MSKLPHISWVTLTYARKSCLEECLQCFLNQKYDGELTMVILNTFPSQKLVFEHPRVKVVNLDERPKTLGDARNIAIDHAEGEFIVIADDDDLYTSCHTANYGEIYANHGQPNWIRLDRQYYMLGWKIKNIVPGTCNVVGFTKAAWAAVGGYDKMNTGEDRTFLSKITEKYPGATVPLDASRISFLYCWGNGEHHISGSGEDKPGQMTGMERMKRWVDDKVAAGQIKTGEIRLQPHFQYDYEQMVETFNQGMSNVNTRRRGKVAIVMLGRYGDILNAMPIAWHVAQRTGIPPQFYVAKEFASVLDAVSYVTPRVLDIPYNALNEAMKVAEHECEFVLRAQIYGHNWNQEKVTPAYNVESWRECGFLREFDDTEGWRLILDRRDHAREAALESSLPLPDKPTILLNLCGGVSSPFSDCQRVFDRLKIRFAAEANIIDLSNVRGERIYDLLGLFDRARVLVSADTATLHLAAASAIPVVAMVNGNPWQGSAPRCRNFMRIGYPDVLTKIGTVEAYISGCLKDKPAPLPPVPPPQQLSQRPPERIFHVYDPHGGDSPRVQRARASWQAIYEQGVVPCPFNPTPRTALDIGDPRPLPYFKDLLRQGLAKAMSEHDIIMWSNGDDILHPLLPDALRLHCRIWDAATSFRCEFRHKSPPALTEPPEAFFAARSEHHMGCDIFAAPVWWWKKHWEEIPDYILAAAMWDLGVRAIIRKHRGYDSTRANLEVRVPYCDLPMGFVSHEWHQSVWATQSMSVPSNAHNSRLFKEWAATRLPALHFHADGQI